MLNAKPMDRSGTGMGTVLFSLACWILFVFWLLGLYMRSGGSRGAGSALEL